MIILTLVGRVGKWMEGLRIVKMYGKCTVNCFIFKKRKP